MPREHICAYGSCHRTDVRVSANTGTQRPRFCTELHAALWLLRDASYSHPDETMRRKLSEAHDKIAALDGNPPPEGGT